MNKRDVQAEQLSTPALCLRTSRQMEQQLASIQKKKTLNNL